MPLDKPFHLLSLYYSTPPSHPVAEMAIIAGLSLSTVPAECHKAPVQTNNTELWKEPRPVIAPRYSGRVEDHKT